ncbi:MAG: ABC transporter permease [Veillonellaceae bacterium]|nr:ABC transporter permease [Veillonellaceae bacterium]
MAENTARLAPSYGEQVLAIADVEIRKLLRDPTEVFSRSVQPMLWLLVFGQVFSKLRDIPTGGLSYLAYMAPGILAQSVLFSAIFFGISVIWEKDMGIIHKLLVSPAPRSALVLGKAVSSGARGLVQAVIVYLIAFLLHIELNLSIPHVLGVLLAVVLGSAIFSTFSLIIACLVKSRERFMGIGQVLTMPLFFASNAIYPIALMPDWLKLVAWVNPLTYLVDAMRTLMIQGAQSVEGLAVDFSVMTLIFVAFVGIATKLYPDLVR